MRGRFMNYTKAVAEYIIKGKPLFWYARHNKLPAKLPTNKIKIKQIKINKVKSIDSPKLLKQILEKINLVSGDFRQEKIKKEWKKILRKKQEYKIIDTTIKCSSGTYIRSIANSVGGLLLDLERAKIGKIGSKTSYFLK